MLSKRTILSSLAAVALAGGVVAQTSAPALAWHRHHHDDTAIAIGAGALGLALGATLLAPRNVYYDDGYYDYDAPPPRAYYRERVYVDGPYPPPPRPVRVYETRRGHVERCLARYRSYDPRTDTFMGYDGRPHYCRF